MNGFVGHTSDLKNGKGLRMIYTQLVGPVQPVVPVSKMYQEMRRLEGPESSNGKWREMEGNGVR